MNAPRAGNKGLCGKPLEECTAAQSSSSPASAPTASAAGGATTTSKSTVQPTPTDEDDDPTVPTAAAAGGPWKPSTASIVIVAIVVGVAVCGILAAAFILTRCRNQSPESIEAGPPGTAPPPTTIQHKQDAAPESHAAAAAGGRLSFVREDRGKFELTDLLKASAEILGAGCFGSSYKAALSPGQVMVVKRFKQMNNVGREEFHEHMRRLGRLKHTNLLPLVAYYYRKEEKLLVHDFVPYGSLAVHLHGHQALGQPSLEWENRLKIIKGVARGLSYLHKELPTLIAAHGHLKSNNVLLDENEAEVVEMVRIGLGCCEADVERRFDVKEAVERIEEVKVNDRDAFDDDFYSSYSESTTAAGGGGGGGDRRRPSRELSADFSGIS
ncbi:unnamed protein product [Linum tenue]|uniref:Protein kinase domain-containing protein n=1 Tax=Linum tenue TaxID=586396 RepID=A0AAV0S4Y4_9ROSI|nr:unnamed protein product [Linum tenue]